MGLPVRSALLGQRDFRCVYSAAVVSTFGDGLLPVALAFAVLDATRSASDLGLVLGARAFALLASLLVGGVVADRVRRRDVMITADLARFAAQAAVGVLFVTHSAAIWEVMLAQVVLGAGSGFFNPASTGLLPAVTGAHLREANAMLAISRSLSNIAGPAVAGVLVVVASPGVALLIDAITYLISALLLLRAANPAPQGRASESPHRRGFLAELRTGLMAIRSRNWIWIGLLVFSALNLVASAFPVLGPLVAKQRLGGAGAWAAILAVRAAGGLIGGTLVLRISPSRPLLVGSLACAFTAVPTMLLGIPAPLGLLIAVALAAGVGPVVFNTLWETALQSHVPDDVRSRVSSFDWFGSLALQPIGLAVIGPLAATIGTSGALWACGLIEWLLAASLLAVRDVRQLPPMPLVPNPAV